MKRDKAIDVLRAIGIILMVAGHIGFGKKFDIWIHGFHMPMFYFISGWFFKKDIEKFTTFVLHKVKTLIIPYFAYAAVHYLIGHFVYGMSLLKEAKDILFDPTIGQVPIAGALWFLPALFWIEILFYILHRLMGKKEYLLWGVSMVTGLVGIVLVSVFNIHLPMALDAAIPGLMFISTGYLFKCKKDCKPYFGLLNMKWYVWLVVTTLVTALIFVNGMVNFRSGKYGNYVLTYVNAIMYTLILWQVCRWFVVLTEKGRAKKIAELFAGIGAGSIVFLCLNQLPIYVLKKAGILKLYKGSALYYPFHGCILLAVLGILYIYGKVAGKIKENWIEKQRS